MVGKGMALVLVVFLAALQGAPAAAQNGRVAGPPSVVDGNPGTTERLSVGNSVDGAIAISQARFSDGGAERVVMATSGAFADALAASPFLATAPLLLTPTGSIPAEVMAEVERVVPAGGEVILLGGTAALGEAVQRELDAEGFETLRLAGPDRIETAIEVVREFTRRTGTGSVVAVARAFGEGSASWADSVTAGGWAADTGTPLLLTPTETLDTRVASLLAELSTQSTIVIGGTAALSVEVEAAVPGPSRAAGPDRAATAAAISQGLWGPRAGYLIINGYRDEGWAFGLAASGLAADLDYPLLVADSDRVPDATLGRVGLGCGATPGIETLVIGDEVLLGPEVVTAIDFQDGAPCPAPPAPPPPSDFELARIIPGSRMYAYQDCPPPPESSLIPPGAFCVTVLAIDLDGDGTGFEQLDRVIMYHGDQETVTVAGYSSRHGKLRPYRTASFLPPQEDGPVSGYALECAVDLDVGPASELLLTTSVGANTIFGQILEVRDGAIQATLDAQLGGAFTWTFGGSVRHGSGYRVGTNRFTQYLYDDESGSPFAFSGEEYVLIGGTFVLTGVSGGRTDDPGPYAGSGCPGGSGTFPPP